MGILLPRAQAQRGLGTAVGREAPADLRYDLASEPIFFFFVSLLVLYVFTEECCDVHTRNVVRLEKTLDGCLNAFFLLYSTLLVPDVPPTDVLACLKSFANAKTVL